MKIAFALILIILAVAVGVIAMAALLPVNNGLQVAPMLTYGAIMFLCGVAAFGLVLMGLMMLYDDLRSDLGRLIRGEEEPEAPPTISKEKETAHASKSL